MRDQPQEVHILLSSSKTGGINTYYRTLATGLRCCGCEVRILDHSIAINLLILLRYSLDRSRRLVFYLWGVYSILPPTRHESIVTFHGVPSAIYQGMAPALLLRMAIFLNSFVYKRKCISVSLFVYSLLRHYYSVETCVIHNALPFDCSKFLRGNPHPIGNNRSIDFLFVGRIEPVKLPWYCVEAVVQTCQRTGSIFHVYGPASDYADVISKRLAASSMDSYIVFHLNCERSRVLEALANAKLFVSFSECEPFGIVYLEAYASGCYLVGPSCGGFSEIAHSLQELSRGTSRFFTYQRPSPEDVSVCLEHALEAYCKCSENGKHLTIDELSSALDASFGGIMQANKYIRMLSA